MTNSIWKRLLEQSNRMGDAVAEPIDFTLAPVKILSLEEVLRKGVVINLDDLDETALRGGLLGYQGAQVLLYIRDQPVDLDIVLRYPDKGNKYHVAFCRTLQSMQANNRFERYVATNDVSGEFDLTRGDHHVSQKARGKLNVCKNCLNMLNYRGHRVHPQKKHKVFSQFSLTEFFTTYSTLFEQWPSRRDFNDYGAHRAPRGWTASEGAATCSSCTADFAGSSQLLRSMDGPDGLLTVCVDCLRKPPHNKAIFVSAGVMQAVNQHRNLSRSRSDSLSWDDAFAYSDTSFHGLLSVYQKLGYSPPEPGYDLLGDEGSVVVTLSLAWPDTRRGVVLKPQEKDAAVLAGWESVMTLEEGLLDSMQDG